MTTAIGRLETLLDEKDDEIRALYAQIEELKNALQGSKYGWTWHQDLPEEQTLPVPRLEMVVTPDESRTEFLYRLVYRHLLGHCVGVPFALTTRSGGRYMINGKPSRTANGETDLPYRSGTDIKHDARSLGFPAFVLCEGIVEQLHPANEEK